MSEEQLKAFIEKVQGDDNLQVKLKGAANSDAVVSIAKEAGFSISADDLNKASELSEEELEGLAGGGVRGGTAAYMCPTDRNRTCKPVATCPGLK